MLTDVGVLLSSVFSCRFRCHAASSAIRHAGLRPRRFHGDNDATSVTRDDDELARAFVVSCIAISSLIACHADAAGSAGDADDGVWDRIAISISFSRCAASKACRHAGFRPQRHQGGRWAEIEL
jgi:hypothetical protein